MSRSKPTSSLLPPPPLSPSKARSCDKQAAVGPSPASSATGTSAAERSARQRGLFIGRRRRVSGHGTTSRPRRVVMVAGRNKVLVPSTIITAPSDGKVGIDDGEAEAKSTTADEAAALAGAETDDANWESSSDNEDVLEPAVVAEVEEGHDEDAEHMAQKEEEEGEEQDRHSEPWPRVPGRFCLPLSYMVQDLRQKVPRQLVRVRYSHKNRWEYGNGKWQVRLLNTVEEVDGF